MRLLFAALETREQIVRVLDIVTRGDGVQIFIGAQNELFGMAGCSMVVAPFVNTREQIIGAIGVVGPTRLNYARIIPMVDYTAKLVGRMLELTALSKTDLSVKSSTHDKSDRSRQPFDEPFEQCAADAGRTRRPFNAVARIAELEALVETLKSETLLALAEAENASKRADKRISDNAKYAVSNICKALLPVADNLGRALLAAPGDVRASNDALKNLATGVELTEKELVTVLENQGVRKMNALNQPFDANFHNAIQEVENTTVPAGTVVQVYQDGYVIHDRLLRPAMVVVSKGGPKRETPRHTKARRSGVKRTV